jgi:hypothetical protein
MTKTINQDAVELIRRVYGDSNGLNSRSLDFKSEGFRNFEEFSAALRTIGQYNAFDPEAVIAKLKDVWPKLMDVKIAREGSPALYFGIPYWTNQQIGWEARYVGKVADAYRLTTEQRSEITQELSAIIADLEADEVEETKYEGLRVWWD